ncbi:ATP-binding cassette domain-containing protein, partial [Streptomyces sp. NRRL F-4711]|uniref:ATP-binding cassette domain-containing protein n=1 Tax=Streptomyces sp. NRRL F-4711 TaxID=1519476 RepID=UPI003B6428B8
MRHVHLTPPPGATAALTGPNGAGPSTPLPALGALAEPSAGTVPAGDAGPDRTAPPDLVGPVGPVP